MIFPIPFRAAGERIAQGARPSQIVGRQRDQRYYQTQCQPLEGGKAARVEIPDAANRPLRIENPRCA